VHEQITGGEKFNWAMIEAAKNAGIKIVVWEGKQIGRNIALTNLRYLIRCFSIKKPCFVILDIDYCSRFLLALTLLKIVRKVPVLGVVFHFKFTFQDRWGLELIHRLIETAASRSFNSVITISRYSLATFAAIARKKIKSFLIPPFVKSFPGELPAQRTGRLGSPMRLIAVGAIDPRKNIHMVLRSLQFLRFPFHLDVVGHKQSDSYYSALMGVIERAGIESKCTFHGFLEKDRLDDLLIRSDAFILVSEMEGYGMAYAEAMKFGLPIIGSNRGALPELVVNNENGFLCEPNDPESISEAISQLNDQETWNRMSDANKEKYKTLMDRETFVQKCEQVFLEIQDDFFLRKD